MSQLQEGQLTNEKLNDGELTQEQLALLNNLMYLNDISREENVGKPLGEYLAKVKIDDLPEGVADTSHEDWKNIINTVQNDEKLKNMTITSTLYDKNHKKESAICIVDDNNNATVVFRGTASQISY